jgi:hypothetical protein
LSTRAVFALVHEKAAVAKKKKKADLEGLGVTPHYMKYTIERVNNQKTGEENEE